MNVGEKIKVFLGMTDKSVGQVFERENQNSSYPAAKVFIHPLLGTEEVCTMYLSIWQDLESTNL